MIQFFVVVVFKYQNHLLRFVVVTLPVPNWYYGYWLLFTLLWFGDYLIKSGAGFPPIHAQGGKLERCREAPSSWLRRTNAMWKSGGS